MRAFGARGAIFRVEPRQRARSHGTAWGARKGGRNGLLCEQKPGQIETHPRRRARCTRACTDTWESTLAGVACAAPEAKAAVSPSTAPGAEAASPEGPSSKRQRTEETAASLTTPYDRLPSDVKIELLEAALKKARTDIIGSKFEAALTARNERRVARCYFCGEAGGFCE